MCVIYVFGRVRARIMRSASAQCAGRRESRARAVGGAAAANQRAAACRAKPTTCADANSDFIPKICPGFNLTFKFIFLYLSKSSRITAFVIKLLRNDPIL